MDDMIFNMFATPPGGNVGLGDFLLRLLVAFLGGQAIGWMYGRSHNTLSYSQNFVQSLVMLSMVVAVIMGVVGDSLARAFGLAAALAIVRFRTPVKDARDTTFLFLSVATGMAAGAGQLAIGATSALVIGMVAIYLKWTAFGSRSDFASVVRFRFHGDSDTRPTVDAVLREHCGAFQLSAARKSAADGPEELVYDVSLRDYGQGDAFVRDLAATGHVTGVALLPLARAGEA